jgi:hypothetical protein
MTTCVLLGPTAASPVPIGTILAHFNCGLPSFKPPIPPCSPPPPFAGKLLAGSKTESTVKALDGYLARLDRLGRDDKHVPSRLRFLVRVACVLSVKLRSNVCVCGGGGAVSVSCSRQACLAATTSTCHPGCAGWCVILGGGQRIVRSVICI